MRRLLIALTVYTLVLGVVAVIRWRLWTYGADTGTFAQIVASAFTGFTDGPEQGTHFRFHWAPVLALLWPLIALARSPLVLQFAQIGLVGATALPLYAIARPHVGNERAWRYAALALIYPPLTAVAFAEFHEIAFYPVVALGLIWAAQAERWLPFAALALVSATIREEACMVFAIAGVGLVVMAIAAGARPRGGEPNGLLVGRPPGARTLGLAGAGLMAINLAALAVYFRVVIPSVGAWHPLHFYVYPFATGPLAVTIAIVLHPAYAAQILTFGRLTYVIEAFAPLALLPLRSRWTLLALPGLGIVLLSSDAIAWRMGSHYSAIFAPWLLLAAVAALVRLDRGNAYRAALALCAIVLVFFDPMHPAHYLRPLYPQADARAALAAVPPGVSVVTHDEWYTQIALRQPDATIFYCPYVRYAVYADDFPSAGFRDDIRPQLQRDLREGRARVVARYGRVAVYRRTPPRGATPANCVRPGDLQYHRLAPLQ